MIISDAPAHGTKYHDLGKDEDNYPDGDPEGRVLEDKIVEIVDKKIQIAALRITKHTEKMFGIMNEVYQQKSGKPILFSKLGKSIEHFNFFLTQSISQTLNISSLRNGGATSESLVSRLL